MTEPAGEKKKNRIVRAAMWALAIFSLGWIFLRVPLPEVIRAVKMVEPLGFASAALGFLLCTFALDSFTHHALFKRFNGPADARQVIMARGESYLLLALGFLYGQGGMAYLASRRLGKPLIEISGSILFLMFCTLCSLLVFPTIALLFFREELVTPELVAGPEWRIAVTWIIASWPIIALALIFWIPDWNFSLRKKLKGGIYVAFDRARPADYALFVGLRILQIVLWLFFAGLAMASADVHIKASELALLGPIVGLVTAVPTPGRIGPAQGAYLVLFHGRAADANLLAYSLLWAAASTALRWIFGVLFLAAGRVWDREK